VKAREGNGVATRSWAGARRSATESSQHLVRLRELAEGEPLPLLLEPAEVDVDLPAWAAAQRDRIEELLLVHGALLFRGFGLRGAGAFEAVARALCPDLHGEYGDLPREAGLIYRSTPYPADQAILFHNEASHTARWPMKQFFYCQTPAAQGGETPIVDCRRVHERLDGRILRRFADQGVMYVRNFIPGLDVPWQEFFRTQERAAVEATCRAAGVAYEWRADGGLRTREVRPAVAVHPKTGARLFFNQLQLHHASCLEASLRESMKGLFAADDFPRDALYGDGQPIEDAVVDEIRSLYQELAVSFPWEAGDVLLLDNMLTAHARNPYAGPRKILVAMGEMTGGGR
jgi:alpha-ketoglutarate-dependent taurine dioxygenase